MNHYSTGADPYDAGAALGRALRADGLSPCLLYTSQELSGRTNLQRISKNLFGNIQNF